MSTVPSNTTDEEAFELATIALGSRPLHIQRQQLTSSGKAIYRVDQEDGRSVVLRTSVRPKTFAFTRSNLDVLRALGLPVQSVLAAGATTVGGSYIILDWMPGRDLVHELNGMSHEQMTRVAEQVVDYQRRVVSLPPAKGFGWAPIGRNGPLKSWSATFGEAQSPVEANDGTSLGNLRARLCRLRSRVEAYFDSVQATPFLDDLTTKNVLVHHGKLSGIIDVDFVCYGDPLLTVGATLSAIISDIPEGNEFYAAELIRCWNPSAAQERAIWFYAALWAIGFLRAIDRTIESARFDRLSAAAESWLMRGEC